MKFPKKLIAFGLSLCMSVVPCGPVAAEDFTDAQTDMTDAIDTFTDDGSFANKFDFMDSDGLTKSITGSIAKTAAKIAPYFIPGVNYVYTAANVAMELGDALPALSKSLAGIFGSDISNNAWLNKV